MNHSGPTSLLQRIVKKALPSARFRAEQNSSECRPSNIPKMIIVGYKGHNAAPSGERTPYHSSYWHMVTQENQIDHINAPGNLPLSRQNCGGTLSIQTHRHSSDISAKEAFSLDKFIRENESWTPPSPREVLSRRQFREARQASNTQPQTTTNQPSSGYLVRRPVKS